MKKTKPKNPKPKAAQVVLGAGIVAALAGAYLLYGSKGAARNRKVAKGWVVKAKGEVLEELESLKEASEGRYNAIVDGVLKKYESLKTIDRTEIAALRSDLKKHWKNIEKDFRAFKGDARKGKGLARKTAKTISKVIKNKPKSKKKNS